MIKFNSYDIWRARNPNPRVVSRKNKIEKRKLQNIINVIYLVSKALELDIKHVDYIGLVFVIIRMLEWTLIVMLLNKIMVLGLKIIHF